MALSCSGVPVDAMGREIKRHGTVLLPAACYQELSPQAVVPWHWHEEMEVILVAEGSARLRAKGRAYTLTAGEGCFINSGVLHALHGEGNTLETRSVVFHPRLVGGSMDSIFWQGYVEPILSDQSLPGVIFSRSLPWGEAAVEAIRRAWSAGVEEAPGYEFQMRQALSDLILLLHQNQPARRPEPTVKELRDGERIKGMLRYIQDHLAEELTVEEIARAGMVSKSECLRCFKTMISGAPMQYVKELRLQRAARLLRESTYPVSRVAELCGFQDLSYFAKSFRLWKGCTPREYREAAKEEKKH